ncbi:MAG: glycine-rich protein, partial [Candidatus Cybelea sp.]
MRTSDFCRFALGICAVAAMLGGCGSHSDNGAVLPSKSAVPPVGANKGIPHHRSFYYTGREQRFRVPAGVKSIGVVARGGGGANATGSRASGGRGGRVHAFIPVTPGEMLAIYVGGEGSGMNGGFNGGADGGQKYYCNCPGAGGGGASDVRQGGDGLADRVLVVGGGGG